MLTLPAGQYLGDNLQRCRAADSPLTVTSYRAGHDYPWHVHEVPTLFVLLSGQHRDENRRFVIHQSPLSIVFHPTHGPHSTRVGPRGMVGINVELTDAWLARWQLQARDLNDDYRMLDSAFARMLACRLAVAMSSSGGGRSTDIHVESTAVEIVACLVRESQHMGSAAPHWIARAQEYLLANARCAIGLRDLAAEVRVHPVYCARAFRRSFGCTVTDYLHQLRLLDAIYLVLDQREELRTAALRAGFADQAHLTRLCSRTLGFTPGDVKRLRRELLGADGSNRSRTDCA
jgi:AraC family transcriptional regulator